MRDHRELLRAVDREDVPDLWPEIGARTPRDLDDRGSVATRVTAGIVAAAIAVLGIGFVVVAFDRPAPPPPVPQGHPLEDPLPPITLDGDPRVVGTIPLPPGDMLASAVAAADGSTWVATTDGRGEKGTLLRVDGLTSEVTTSIEVDFTVSRYGFHVAGGSLWVVAKEARLLRYDAVSGVLLDQTTLPGEGVALEVDHDSVWVEVVPKVFDPDRPWSAALVRLDAATLDVEATIPLDQLVTGYDDEVRSTGDVVWVMGPTLQDDDTEVGGPLVKVSRSTNEIVDTFDVRGLGMLPTGDEVWVRTTSDGIFDGPDEDWQWLRVDADSGETSVVSLAERLAGLVIDDGRHLWFANYDGRERVVVTKADRSSFRIVSDVVASERYYTDVAVDPHTGQLWIAGFEGAVRVDLTDAPRSTPSPSGTYTPAERLEGVPFPVCDARSISGEFGEDFGVGADTVWVVRREAPDGAGCEVTQPFTWVGIGTHDRVLELSEAIPDTALVTGVPWPYASPDLDGDGIDEIALGLAGSTAEGWVDVKLFHVLGATGVEEIGWTAGAALDPSQPVTIGSTEGGRHGVYCGVLGDEAAAGQPPSIVTWSSGVVSSPDTVRGYRYTIVDGELRFATSSSWRVAGLADLPPDGRETLCGSPTFPAP
jgi:hypothetical protein